MTKPRKMNLLLGLVAFPAVGISNQSVPAPVRVDLLLLLGGRLLDRGGR